MTKSLRDFARWLPWDIILSIIVLGAEARWLRWDIILSIIAVGAEAISAALEQTSPHKARWLRWDIILSIIAVGAEAISAALEQTSPHKVKAARYGVIMAIVSVLLTFADLACNKYMLIRDKNTRPNNNHHKLRWEFADSFGSISSILTLISSCLHYNFLSNGKQQPIEFSTIPLAFSVCVFCSRVLRQPSHKHKPTFVLNCKLFGLINLDIESGGILFDNDEPTQFACPVCQIEQIHP